MREKLKLKRLQVSIISLLLIMKENIVSATRIPVNNFTIDMNSAKQVESIGNGLLGTIQVIGVFASVAALMLIGIKYMLGSAEERSEKKETMIYYVIGAILVLCISAIVPYLYDVIIKIFTE